MDTNKEYDFNADARSSRSVSTSMDKRSEEESTHNNSLTEQASGRKGTSRIRHKRKEYSPEVSVAPLYKRFSLSEDFSVIKDGVEPETSRSLLNTSRARSKNVVKRYTPSSETSSTQKEKDESTHSQKEVILLSHLGELLRKEYSQVEHFALDYRKLGVKVKDISPDYTVEPLSFKLSNSDEQRVPAPVVPEFSDKKSASKRTSSIKLKLPRKHSVEKLLKQEAQSSTKEEGESSKESSVVSTPDHLEMSSPSESGGRPKRLAAGKSRDFISQLVAPNRRLSKASEHAASSDREKSVNSTSAEIKSEEKEGTPTGKPVDTANIVREAEKIASALTELTSRPKRISTLTPKMRSIFTQKGDKKDSVKNDFKIAARPNSALDILRNTKLYQRVRSPSPINTTIPPVSKPATPPQTESMDDLKQEEAGTETKDDVSDIVDAPSPEIDDDNVKDIKVEEVSSESIAAEEDIVEPPPDVEDDIQEEDKMSSELGEVSPVSLTFQAKPGRSKGKLLNENDSPVKPIPEIAAPVLPIKKVEPVRSSRRIIKPVKFEDFVTDHPLPKNERTASSSAASVSDIPSSSEETPVVEVAKPVAKQRPRKSSISSKRKSEPQPIRLKLRLDGKRSSVIGGVPKVTTPEPPALVVEKKPSSIPPVIEEGLLSNDEEVFTPQEIITPSSKVVENKVKRKSGKSWIMGYTPSVKPVLEDLVHTNGTVEKIGVVVYAVMDRILLEVCQDGVVRHSGAISKKDRRQRAMGIARQRYLEKKAEYEVLKAACLARGETPPVFSHTLTTHKRYSRSSLPSDADCLSSGRAERSKKGGIYKQNEYLMKTNKSRKFSESDDNEGREPKIRKMLDFTSPSQHREIKDEKLLHEKRKRKPDEYPVRNENDYYSHERIQEIREKQREKAVPFSIFLEKKPEGLSQSLCINTPITSSQPHDFFYRDLLYGSRMTNTNSSEYVDDDIDIIENEKTDYNDNDFVINSDAKSLATHIGTLLMRPSQPDGSYSISDFFSLIREETELRRAIVNQAMDIITDQYVTEQVSYDVNANVTVYNTTLRNASLLRDVFNMFSEERQSCVYWVHRTFLETLPEHFLASYLILLRYCKTLTNSYIGKVIKNCASDSFPWPEVVELLTEFTNTKVVDPDLDMLNRTVTSCLLSDVVFLLVSPAISAGDFVLKARYHENVFRWLKQMGHPASEVMRMSFNEDYENYSVAQLCDTMIDKIVQKIKQLTKSHRDKRIVLVGWQTTCFFNHRAVQLTHGVSAIIDLAFPVLTTEGPRGSADDDILLTYCPSLFIAGSESEDFDAVAMRELRSHMIVPTGLVVVANADANLMVSNTVLNKLCITQKTVHRALVEQVNHFLKLDETRKERSQLIPVELNNVYNVDPSKFSAKDKQKLTTEKEEASRSKKKRFTGPFSPTAPAMPALSAEMTLSTSQARNRFDLMLKKSLPQHYDARKVKEDVTRKESFREPRAPPVSAGYKSSPLPSPSVRPSSSEASNLLDPALISLS